jgi:hypothetical protein
MKIAVIGAGNVGGTLGKAFAARGHEIWFGVRNPRDGKAQELAQAAGGKVQVTTTHEAAAAADIVLLATPWHSTHEAVQSLGDLAGKVVIDATNPLKPDLSGLALGLTTSAGEEVARWAAGARVVKAFNTIGAGLMANPRIGHDRLSLFLCGDEAAAKRKVGQLAAELGFDVVDCGPLSQARLLEPLAMLWISLAYQQGLGTSIAFRLLKR